MIFLENEYLKASFAIKGAELQSLKNKNNHTEYLWSGNPHYWGKFSPVLFPIVGGLKQNTYYYKNKAYHLPRHGFARDKNFEPDQISSTTLVFSLKHDEETLKVYPFPFELQLRYTLTGATLSCSYTVSNPAEDNLLFSVGAHPAFATEVNADVAYTDYFLQFNKEEILTYHKIREDLVDNLTATIALSDRKLPLTHELFYQDALILKTLKGDCISLRNHKNTTGIHFSFKNFPFFGIWAAKDADFVCLEPWQGIADGIDHNQHLEHKEGIIVLPPGKQWTGSWAVECF